MEKCRTVSPSRERLHRDLECRPDERWRGAAGLMCRQECAASCLLARIVPVRINARPPYMGRLKSSANSWCFLFSCHSYWRLGGDRPTPIDPHESGGGGPSLYLEQHSDTRRSPLSSERWL